MQPARSKVNSLARRQSAARTHLASAFGSLRGFPVPLPNGDWGWLCIPRDGSAELVPPAWSVSTIGPAPTDAQLREAAKAAVSLPKTFPRVWSDTVGPVDRWEARARAVIGSLRHARESKQLPPRSPPSVDRTARGTSTRSSSAYSAALAWTYAFDPKAAERVSRHAEKLEAVHIAAGQSLSSPHDLARLIQWTELLSAHSPASIDPLLEIWSRPASWHRTLARPTHARLCFDLLPTLASAPAPHRVPILQLLASLSRSQPPVGSLETLTHRLLRLPVAHIQCVRRIVDRFNELSPDPDAVGRLLDGWYGHGAPPAEWLRAMDLYLHNRTCTSAHLAPWIKGYDHYLNEWDYSQRRTFKPERLLDALAALVETSPSQIQTRFGLTAGLLGTVCRFAPDPRTAARCVAALFHAKNDASLGAALARCVWEMARHDPGLFGALGARIAKALESESATHVEPPTELLDQDTLPLGWLGDLVVAGHTKDVLALLRLTSMAVEARLPLTRLLKAADQHLRESAPPLPTECPPSLSDQIKRLSTTDPGALQAAAHELPKAFPPSPEVERELSRIENLITSAPHADREGLTRRRRTLQARLSEGWNITATKQSKVIERVRARAQRVRLAAWCQALRDEHRTWMERSLGASIPQAWLSDALTVRCLRALAALPDEFRTLAGRVLAEAIAGTWAGHLSAPANRRWVEQARQAGIKTDVWLSGIAACEFDHPSLGALTIDIERDPLEVMKIGAWFATCLSPHDMNFFSTVVIAADANKHVLVVRTPRGEPIARRIVAIDRNMRLWAFRLYAHQRDPAIESAVEGHIARLSQRCGIVSGGIADVESLTASEWYDDEDERDQEQFSQLLDEHAESSSLLSALRHACGEATTRQRVLDWIASHGMRDSMASKPDLSRRRSALLRLLEELLRWNELEGINERNIHGLLAVVTSESPPPDAASTHPSEATLLGHVLAKCRTLQIASPELARAFLRTGDPVEAMRVLRRCKGWIAERIETVEATAEAHLALGRPRKAIETLDRAMEQSLSGRDAERLARRREEIRAGIEERRRSRGAATRTRAAREPG